MLEGCGADLPYNMSKGAIIIYTLNSNNNTHTHTNTPAKSLIVNQPTQENGWNSMVVPPCHTMCLLGQLPPEDLGLFIFLGPPKGAMKLRGDHPPNKTRPFRGDEILIEYLVDTYMP